jgi:heme/copper-type cytochrome/quinol oxidase subunit 3
MSKHPLENKHPFHLVENSPWPFGIALSVFFMVMSEVSYMHGYQGFGICFVQSLFIVFFLVLIWCRDIIREATFEGKHTLEVQRIVKFAVLLFFASEVMFFSAVFAAFFNCSIIPSVTIGGIWPPKGVEPFSPWGLAFLNTLILLASGASVTWAHHALKAGLKNEVIAGLSVGIVLGCLFSVLQTYEYLFSPFTISDGIYGATFYLATGFHGLHVCAGVLLLNAVLAHTIEGHYTAKHHVGFEAALWYWHLVDVVWLFLFVSIYWWGGESKVPTEL